MKSNWPLQTITIVLILGALGCLIYSLTPQGRASIEARQAINKKVNEEQALGLGRGIGSRLQYFKDQRTGLCYAYLYNYNSPSITNVPCTEQVEKLVAKGVTNP